MARSIGKRGRPGVEGKEKPRQIPVFLEFFFVSGPCLDPEPKFRAE